MVKKVKYVDGFAPRTRRGSRRSLNTSHTVNRPRRGGSKAAKTTRGNNVAGRKIAIDDFTEPVGTLNLNSEQIEKDLARVERKNRKTKKGKKSKKKWSKKRKIITVLIVLFVLIVGVGAAFYIWGQGLLNKISNGNIGIWDILTAKDVELKKGANGRTNVLVLGTSGYDMGGSEHDGAQLTDSIMILSLDQASKDVAMLSLPRDLYVGNTCTDTGKVNEIYWCNNQDEDNELGGVRAAQEEIGEILGLDFQYYVHMNWGALVQLVEALGGVTVTLDEDIADDWTNTYVKAGVPTTLNGEDALGLARARHGTASGDFSRGNSQQKILIAIKEKALENGVSLGQAMEILGVLGDNVRMDFNADEMKTIFNMLQDFPMENLRHVTLLDPENNINLVTTGTLNNGISYVLPAAGNYNYSEIQKYLKQMFSTDGVGREGAKILVLNGTETMGVASAEERRLEEKGFIVADIADAPAGVCETSYCVYDFSDGKKPVTLEKLKEFYSVGELLAKGTYPIEYYVEPPYDFIVIVGKNDK